MALRTFSVRGERAGSPKDRSVFSKGEILLPTLLAIQRPRGNSAGPAVRSEDLKSSTFRAIAGSPILESQPMKQGYYPTRGFHPMFPGSFSLTPSPLLPPALLGSARSWMDGTHRSGRSREVFSSPSPSPEGSAHTTLHRPFCLLLLFFFLSFPRG